MNGNRPSRAHSIRRDRRDADQTIRDHPLFPKLKESYPKLDPIQRAAGLSEIYDDVKHNLKYPGRALGRVFNVDPGTIRRFLKLHLLNDVDKEKVRIGKSVASVLREAGAGKAAAGGNRGPEQKVDELRNRVIKFFECLELASGHVQNILEFAIRGLPGRHREWYQRGRKPSRMSPDAVIRYKKPPEKIDFTMPMRGLSYYTKWLVRWVLACQPELAISEAALHGALKYFFENPTGSHPFGTKCAVYEDIARAQLAEMNETARLGAECMRDPQSTANLATVADAERRRMKADVEEAEQRAKQKREQMQKALSGDKSHAAAGQNQPRFTPVTIGEELIHIQKPAQARAATRTRSIRHEMGWEAITHGRAFGCSRHGRKI